MTYNSKQLVKEIYRSIIGTLPAKSKERANHFAGVGEWGQAGTALLGAAMRNNLYIPRSLVEQALSLWGLQEMGNMFSSVKEHWRVGDDVQENRQGFPAPCGRGGIA